MAGGIDTSGHPQRQVSREAKSALTRTRNKVQSIENEYGARDIPASHPLYAKVSLARQAHAQALRSYTTGQ